MEYVQGPDLRSSLKDKNLQPLLDAIVLQIAEGIRTLHSHGIMHRDLKPSNVLLTSSRFSRQEALSGKQLIKICDVGEASLISMHYHRLAGEWCDIIAT